MYQLELVWNREFDFVPHGRPRDTLEAAIEYLKAIEDMGDGARVKKTRIVNQDGVVVYAYGRLVRVPDAV